MKKLSMIGCAVIVGISVIGNWSRTNVAHAQTVPDCPLNSACVWSERNFTGTRTVYTVRRVPLLNGLFSCSFSGYVNIGRSVRNNTLCYLNISVSRQGGNSDDRVSPNSQLADSGEFRRAY